MTMEEAGERYHIPAAILKEYESWGLCDEVKKVMGMWQYDEQDLERLSMIMTLHDTGFENSEIKRYMRLMLQGGQTAEERLRILNEKRGKVLDGLHFRQKQLDRLDYLRYQIREAQDHGTKKEK